MPGPPGHKSPQGLLGSVLVVGGGRFGQLALGRLGRRVRAVVEPHPSSQLLQTGAQVWRQDGAVAVERALAEDSPPRWIVPCLPRHLLADWLRLTLTPWRPRPAPMPPGLPQLAQVLPGPEHICYLSLTNTICPDDCPEPGRVCPKTELPRGMPLFARLARLRLAGLNQGALRSHQLAPGVGGIKTSDMLKLRQKMAERGGRWLVGAACRCHAVIQILELDQPQVTQETQ